MRLRGTGGDRPLRRENHPVRRFKRVKVVGTGPPVAGLIAHLHVSADFSHCSAVKQSG